MTQRMYQPYCIIATPFSQRGILFPQKGVKMARKEYIQKAFTFNGKRYYAYGKTEAEAIRNRELKRIALEQGKVITEATMTLAEWSAQCIETYKVNCSEKTKKDFTYTVNGNILPLIGAYQLKAINEIMCQQVMNSQKGKSASQISKVYQAMRFLFDKAKALDLINKNPALHLEKPLGQSLKRRALTQDEQELITRVALTKRKYYGYLLMLYCGCRPSEAFNVTAEDISVLDGVPLLHIRGTKTLNANRTVPLPKWLYDEFKGLQGYICLTEMGTKINKNRSKNAWYKFRNELNLALGCKTYRNKLVPPYPLASDIVQYCLRHTYCTNLAKKGVDIRTAQKLMGHSDISLTANIYTHTDNDDILNAAKLINSST